MIDERAIRAYRLGRVRAELDRRDLAAIVLLDPINVRYATGTRNMQVWTMHNVCRYAFVPAAGPVVLFELPQAHAAARAIEVVDEVRPPLSWDYLGAGMRAADMARRWAAEIADLVRAAGGGRLGIDRADLLASQALAAEGVAAVDGKPAMEHARAVKSAAELDAFRDALGGCLAAMRALKAAIRPGLSENQAFATLVGEAIARGGEYPETRLLTSGPRTNPWFQESGEGMMAAGDLVAFDTDMIGRYGFFTDASRTWVVGDARPTDAQRALYDLARRQIEHNTALLTPGASLRELGERSFRLPDDCLPNRYADIAHGCGLGVEYPLILYPEDDIDGFGDAVLEADMIVCVESYVGRVGGHEGVKLEQPVWVSARGPVVLGDYPIDGEFV